MSRPFDPQTFVGPSLEPPEPPLCTWCEGDTNLIVTQVETGMGTIQLPIQTDHPVLVACPRCIDNPGVEPALDPRDDPALDDKIKERQ